MQIIKLYFSINFKFDKILTNIIKLKKLTSIKTKQYKIYDKKTSSSNSLKDLWS